ncbi:hypothetical protein [Sphingomonas daechungensis]|uniref:hypothetical protein n=1 Tax=Sphingomonas daechungensis TaxID=1176646 RepID=UPI0037839DF5
MTAGKGSREPSRIGCIIALALILVPGIVSSVLRGPVGEDWPFAILYGVLLAVPFGYLALEGARNWMPWIVAIALTACFWGALIGSSIFSARHHTGVYFGMGLVMLASPIIVTFSAWAAVRSTKDR